MPRVGRYTVCFSTYGTGHQWGSDSLTTLVPRYAATFFNEVEERQPGATYIKVSSLQDSSQPPITCTNQMSDACLNAGDLRFDASGDFLFVADVVSNRVRVLRVDAAARTLHDTGSSFPFTSSAAAYFSPEIADQSA